MSTAALPEPVRGFLALMSGGDPRWVDDLYADPCRVDGTPLPRSRVRAAVQALRTAFPDARYETLDVAGGPADWALRLRWTGTHRGTYRTRHGSFLSSGRRIAVTGVQVLRLADGRIAETWGQWDDLELLRQIGVLQLGWEE